MARKFRCSNCGREITVQFLKPGEMALCKSCGTEVTVPENAETADDVSHQPPTGPASQETLTGSKRLVSDSTGRWLMIFLWISLAAGLTLFGLIWHLKDSLAPLTHSAAGWVFIAVILLTGPIVIIQTIVFLFWIAGVQTDLKRFYPEHDITPGQAIARLLIPIYHVWGLWNVFSSAADRFRRDKGTVRQQGELLRCWVTPLMILFVIDYALLIRMLPGIYGPTKELSYEGMFSFWEVFGFGLSVISTVVNIRITQLIRTSLRLKQSEAEN